MCVTSLFVSVLFFFISYDVVRTRGILPFIRGSKNGMWHLMC